MLTSADVLNQKFAATKFREGYDQDEVDDFLDRVVETLKEQEGAGRAAKPLTAWDIGQVRFQTTKWREGYDQQEVDAFLDRVREQLSVDAAPAAEPVPAWQPGATPAISGSALVLHLQTMRATRPADAPDTVFVRLPDGTLRPVTDLRNTADGIELVVG
ncbi:DivIVA domain-containing protein [Cellulomonas sp.]|uniref:DivIVA domain-containing protein n=1 Tax=Cellulomonas sp. TaxID=40001 RepID=UPI003BA97ADA